MGWETARSSGICTRDCQNASDVYCSKVIGFIRCKGTTISLGLGLAELRASGNDPVYDGLEGLVLMFGPRMVPSTGSQAQLDVVSIGFNLRLSKLVEGLEDAVARSKVSGLGSATSHT